MSSKKEPLWTRNFVTIAIVNFIIIMIFYLLIVTIAPYAVKELHASTAQAGLISGIYITICRGDYWDRLRERRLYIPSACH